MRSVPAPVLAPPRSPVAATPGPGPRMRSLSPLTCAGPAPPSPPFSPQRRARGGSRRRSEIQRRFGRSRCLRGSGPRVRGEPNSGPAGAPTGCRRRGQEEPRSGARGAWSGTGRLEPHVFSPLPSALPAQPYRGSVGPGVAALYPVLVVVAALCRFWGRSAQVPNKGWNLLAVPGLSRTVCPARHCGHSPGAAPAANRPGRHIPAPDPPPAPGPRRKGPARVGSSRGDCRAEAATGMGRSLPGPGRGCRTHPAGADVTPLYSHWKPCLAPAARADSWKGLLCCLQRCRSALRAQRRHREHPRGGSG
ncbi:immediate early response gene 5 protein-like [Pithys albifrons albifrons]|uniref:immediate early response gene 5 protein-like n=1 Tax=Pithys albifrons albifrons TaxID=3385563 RepID=UPI003A5CADE3